jgi:ABC-2 type transport system permease protein
VVAQFLRLRLAAHAAPFRRGRRHGLGTVAVLLVTLIVTIFVCTLLVRARGGDAAQMRDVLIVAGSVTSLLFLVLPLTARHDGTFDPRSYATLGIDSPRVAIGVGVASLLSVPAVVLAVCALFTVVTWSTAPGAAVLALIAAVVGTATWVLGARLATSLATHFLVGRKARQLAGTLVVLLVVVLLVSVLVPAVGAGFGASAWRGPARALGFTPLGAAWAVGGDAATGDWGGAVIALLIAVVTLAVVGLAWWAWVGYIMEIALRRPARSDGSGLGWFAWMPATPTGAVAARSLTYWARDSRYWVQLVMVPLFAFLMAGALLVSGAVTGHAAALIPLPVICLFLGWVAHNDVAYDGTAGWLHQASATRGLPDRIGRLAPVVLIAIPVLVIGTVLTVLGYGNGDVTPAVIGLNVCVVLAGMGMSSISSALIPYPAPLPGDSAFAHPPQTGAAGGISQAFTLLFTLVIGTTPAVMMALGVAQKDPSWFDAALWTGLALGVVALVVGVWVGAAAYNRRGPELMTFALRNA